MSIYERFEKHADRTFAEAATRYLAELQAKDKGRIARLIDSVSPYIGHMKLIDVDDEAMLRFKADRVQGLPPFKRPAMVGTVMTRRADGDDVLAPGRDALLRPTEARRADPSSDSGSRSAEDDRPK